MNTLVFFAHGMGLVLCHQVEDHVQDFIDDCGGSSDPWSTLDVSIAFNPKLDGLYVGEIKMVDDGPGDYPGTREYALDFIEERIATKEEWEAHCKGDWPWPQPFEVEPKGDVKP